MQSPNRKYSAAHLSHSYVSLPRTCSPPIPYYYYQWSSSVPTRELVGRRVRRKQGIEGGGRSTLDFLKETQGYIRQITLQKTPEMGHRQRKLGTAMLIKGNKRATSLEKYWKLRTEEVKLHNERSRLVYRSPLHLLSPQKSSVSHVILDWGDDFA